MKVIKPQKLGVLFKTYEHQRRAYVAVAVFVYFPFDAPERLLPEVAMWQLIAEELGDVPIDEGTNKIRGELLVYGRCFTPGGKPLPTCPVRVTLGGVDKSVWVIGDRIWKKDVPSEPVPFTEMPLGWARAFGGEGFAGNPIGKGIGPIAMDAGTAHPLPNLELPGHMIASPKDRPTPAGLGPLEISWPQRMSKAGTYDEEWMKSGFPGPAKDIDWTLFNVAPDDQQVDGYFGPGEPFVLENLHPARSRIEGRLPRVKVRCFANRRRGGSESFEESETRIDTVHLFPHAQCGIVVHRALLRVHEDDASDVLQLVVAAESPEAPRTAAHYRGVLDERLDRSRPELLLVEDGLVPPETVGPAHPREQFSDMAELIERNGMLEENQRRSAEQRIEAIRADLKARGLDPAQVPELPPPEPPLAGVALAERVAEVRAAAKKHREQAEAALETAMADLRTTCQKQGLDPDALLDKLKAEQGGPPKPLTILESDDLGQGLDTARTLGVDVSAIEAQLDDPKLRERLAQADEQRREAYRIAAHLMPEARTPTLRRALEIRDEVTARVAAGASFAGRDLTGGDLAGLDLSGADLCGAFLEKADLCGANLRGARLDRAVLARARLDAACLDGATLTDANLGAASLRETQARDVDLRGATLSGADLRGADFSGATLKRNMTDGAKFGSTDFSRVRADGLIGLEADWRGVTLARAELDGPVFLKAQLQGVDFSDATFRKASFVDANADGASFRGAKTRVFTVVGESSFAGSDFSGADLTRACLRGANLSGAAFTGANLESADLGGANLTGANLVRADGKDVRLARADLTGADLSEANLMLGVLQNATAERARFARANLFRADVGRMRTDEATTFDGALVKHTRVVAPLRDDGEG